MQRVICFLLSLVFTNTVLACENGWFAIGDRCFLLLKREAIATAEEGEALCIQQGAHLANIATHEDLIFIENYTANEDARVNFILTGLKWREDIKTFVHPLMCAAENVKMCRERFDESENCGYIYRKGNTETCIDPLECVGLDALPTAPVLCQKNGWPSAPCSSPTTPRTTTTTKKPTTTKPKPNIIADPKKWIIDYSKGTQIHRSYHSGNFIHHYTIDWRNTPSGFNREAGPGFVVSEDRFPQIKDTCPQLLKVGVWRMGAMTYIGNSPPGSFVSQESFYCAPSQFYCGANFLLRRLDKNGGGNIFYASNETEANQQLLGFPPGLYAANWWKETPCWIWKDYTDTWYSIVKANGGMIWGGYHAATIVHFYTLQRHLIPSGFQKELAAPPGYVVTQGLYDSYFKTQCPELISMKIWHGQNGAGQTITWIGREGKQPPSTMKNAWQEELRFYCAPRFNYCNANYLLRRMDKTNGAISYYYPWSESNALSQLRGDAPGVFRNSRWSEEVCYIWANWY